MDPDGSNLSNQVGCIRCMRRPRDDADFGQWEELDEGEVCPGCLTMLEADRRRRGEEPSAE